MQHVGISPAAQSATPALLAACMLAWSPPAQAYLDPMTGSILLQGLLAGVAGLVVVLRLYWARVKGFFRKGTRKG